MNKQAWDRKAFDFSMKMILDDGGRSLKAFFSRKEGRLYYCRIAATCKAGIAWRVSATAPTVENDRGCFERFWDLIRV